jgi:hypothetical protein
MGEHGAPGMPVLIIDSDPQSVEIARSLLSGLRLSEASSIPEARRLLKANEFVQRDGCLPGSGIHHESDARTVDVRDN